MTVAKEDMVEGGRKDLPTKADGTRFRSNHNYQTDYCDTLLKIMKAGGSYKEVASELMVTTRTMHRWVKQFPEWGDAYELGAELSQAWWEAEGRAHLSLTELKDGPKTKFDTKMYTFTLATRFKQREKDDQVHLHIDKDASAERVEELVKKLHKEDL